MWASVVKYTLFKRWQVSEFVLNVKSPYFQMLATNSTKTNKQKTGWAKQKILVGQMRSANPQFTIVIDPWVKTGITFWFLFYVISDCRLSREEGEAAGRFIAFHSLPYWTLHPPAWLGLSKFCLHSANMHARPSVYQALCAGGRGYEDWWSLFLPLRVTEGDTDTYGCINTGSIQGR